MHPKKNMPLFVTLLVTLSLLAIGSGCGKKAKAARHVAEGEKFYATGDYAAAEKEYIAALHINHTNGFAFARLGEMYYDDGRLSLAYPFLVKAYQLDSNNVDLRLKFGQFYLAANKRTEARELAYSVLKARPSDTEAPILLAESASTLKEVDEVRKTLSTYTFPPASKPAVLMAIATLDFRLRDYKKATAEFEAARDADPSFGPVHGALATAYAVQDEVVKAGAEYELSLKTAPYRSARRLRYAQYKLSVGDSEGARKVLLDSIEHAPGYLPAMIALADIDSAQKNFEEANQMFAKIFALDANNYDTLFLSGRSSILQGDYAKAVTQFEKLAKVYPKNANINYQLALAYTSVNNNQAALIAAKQAVTYKPGYTEAQLLLAQLQLASDDAISATMTLKQLLTQNPRSFQGQLLLGDVYRSQGKLADAETVYRMAMEAHPTNAEPPMLLGIVYRSEGRREDARKLFLQSSAIAPGLVTTVEQLTDLDIEDAKYDLAMERAKKIADLDPNAPEPKLLLAKVYMAQRNTNQPNDPFTKLAIDALTGCITNHPTFVSAYMVLSRVYSEAGMDQQAIDVLNKMLDKHGQEQNGWILLGTMLEKQKNVTAAEEAYSRLLQINPDSLIALNNLGCIYSDRGQLDKAYELLKKARSLFPTDPSIADSLGWLSWKRGDYAQAQTLTMEALSRLSQSPDVNLHAALANYMMGAETPAINSFRFVSDTKTDFLNKDMATNYIAILAVNPDAATKADRELIEKRLKESPDDQIALGRLALIRAKAGEIDKAAEAYEAIVKISPKNLRALQFLSKYYAAQPTGSVKAYEMAQAAYKIDPNDIDYTRFLGHLAYVKGDHQFALTLLQQIKKLLPSDKSVSYDLGLAFYSMGQVDKATEEMQAVATADDSTNKDSAARFLDMVGAGADVAAATAAAARIEENLKKDPNNAPALFANALVLKNKLDYKGAKSSYEKMLSIYPSFAPAAKQLIILHSVEPDSGDKLALDMASKIREYYPSDAELDRATGIISFNVGDFPKATKRLRDCVDNNPNDGVACFYLGMSYNQTKQKAEAKKFLTKALGLKLPSSLQDQANQTLATIK